MPTYKDLDRVSNQSSVIAYDIKAKLTDESYAKPPEYYEFERYADFEMGGHFGCFASITTQLITTGSFAIPFNIPWLWRLEAVVTVNNGHGASNTQTIILKSGSVPPGVGYVPFVIEDISVVGTFSFSCDSEILYDIAESQPGPVYMHPPYTILNQYERSTVGGVATCSVTLNGQTVTASSAIVSSQTTEYTYDANVFAYSRGSLAGKEQAILSANLINSIPIPNKFYLFARNADQFVESTLVMKAVTQGVDDVFGESAVTTTAEITVSNTLDRKLKNKGWVNAYNESYPDPLTVEFSYRAPETFTSNYESDTVFSKYEIDSVLTLVNVLTDSVSDNNVLTGNFVNTLSYLSLAANGDLEHTTRMPFRGWSYAGASLYHQKEINLGGGSFLGFYPNDKSFSGYRFLKINAFGGPFTSTFNIRNGMAFPILQTNLSISGGTNDYLIDLCFAYDLHNPADDIVNQDNPYPRWNPLPNGVGTGRTQNQDLFGIGVVDSVFFGPGDAPQVNSYTLYRDDNTAKCDFVAPNSVNPYPDRDFVVVFTPTVIDGPSPIVTEYAGRRYWSQDVQGRNDEEYDLLRITNLTGGGVTYQPQTITGFIDNINNLQGYWNEYVHLGWIGNASTPNDSSSNLRDGYLNEDGYMSWLMGFGMQYIAGTQKFGFDRDLSEETNDYDIFAQTIFDEINGNFIPDYPDPFGIEEPGEQALCLYAFNCVRGAVHGLVQLQELGQTVFVTNPSNVNRGSGVSDVVGRYQTGNPFTQERNVFVLKDTVTCGIATTETDPIVAKRNRVAFYLPPAPTASTVKSADLSKWYQHLIAYVNSNIVSLIYTSTNDFSTFEYLTTNITNSVNVACRWKLNTNTNVIVLAVEKDDGVCYRYLCDDLIGGNSTLSTTLGTGTTPALAINKTGLEIYFLRTTDSGGSVKRIILDSVGNVVEALSVVVSGNVTNDGLATYWYNDTCYLVYNHSSNGITVVTSDDMGITFS
jgi:hypothetical protein